MNIAIFTNNYLPNPFGVSTSIESFRKELEKNGHVVYVFAPLSKGYVDENKNVFRYPAIDLEFRGIRFPLAIPFSHKISGILKELEIDIIHSQHPNLLGWAARKWAKKKNVPLVFTWHTLYDQYAHFAPFFVPRKFAQWWTISNAVRYANQADSVIAPTRSMQEIIEKWGVRNENIQAIMTGILEENFEGANREKIRLEFGIDKDDIVLPLVSRITAEKNMLFLAKAVARILKRNIKVKFVVSGEGVEIGTMRKIFAQHDVEKQVFWKGVASFEEKKNIYAAGDIFAYASKSETQGMVIAEAMLSGLPVVAIEATGVKDCVIDGETGFLTKDDEDEFVGAIQRLVDDVELREKYSENSRKVAKEKYTAAVSARKLLEVYERVVKIKAGS
jgi:glycosyltransferase involved in cell wall biosynthesis